MPPNLFWQATPREYSALAEQYYAAERAQNMRAGTVAAMCMNAPRSKRDQKVWTWEDFFGDPKAHTPKIKSAAAIERAFDKLMKLHDSR